MTTSPGRAGATVVEVRPEVVFLYELIEELTKGRLRIPRFQRPFVWRRDQMTDLLDSVHRQYPIGSLLVWETEEEIATLDHIGPFLLRQDKQARVGYMLDGHQRLSTLAGALVHGEEQVRVQDDDPSRWLLAYNMEDRTFQHYPGPTGSDRHLFPLNALLDTLAFFKEAERVREDYARQPDIGDRYVREISRVAKSFQGYRVPVIRIKQTGLTEAVEIFARMNSKGQPMAADQMVSALMYRQGGDRNNFDLAVKIDGIAERLAARNFGDVDRTTILRAILANLGEDIYRTDWTRFKHEKRAELLSGLRKSTNRTAESLDRTINFLDEIGARTSRLLPYTLQLVLLSTFFDSQPMPSVRQRTFLRRWFWVSSYSGWFGGANPSRVNSLVAEFRNRLAKDRTPKALSNFDIDSRSLPFPSGFDMRSARSRLLLLAMLSLHPQSADGTEINEPWRDIAQLGVGAVGYVVPNAPKGLSSNPGNRMLRPPGAKSGSLRPWVTELAERGAWDVLASHAITRSAATALRDGNAAEFIRLRQATLIAHELKFQEKERVRPSTTEIAAAPIDAD